MAQHKDTAQLAQQIHHVLTFCNWAITNGSSTALLYSKRLVSFITSTTFQHEQTGLYRDALTVGVKLNTVSYKLCVFPHNIQDLSFTCASNSDSACWIMGGAHGNHIVQWVHGGYSQSLCNFLI